MRISVKRGGGFAGLTEDLGTVDTAQLDPATAQQVEQAAGSLAAAASSGGAAIGADLPRYEITISDGSEQTIAFDDDGGPETAPLRELVQRVAELA
ncbi:MAG TPA: protealysin inhibitor emfourin [Thermomicrobiales bacterium]|nr:protealysin inhibitor emfourin [Thermomicrobiales bacterium]